MIDKITNLLSGIFYRAKFKEGKRIIDFLGDTQKLGLKFKEDIVTWEDIIAPTDLKQVVKAISDAIESTDSFKIEYAVLYPDHNPVYIRDVGTVFAEDKEIFIEGYLENISDIKEHHNLFDQHKTLLSQLEKLTRCGNWILNIDNRACWWSDELFKICGIKTDMEASLDLFYQIVHWEDLEIFQKTLQTTIIKKSPFNIQIRLALTGNNVRYIKIAGNYHANKNSSDQILLSINDITQSVKTEKELKIENSRLTRAEQMGETGNWEFDLNNNTVVASWGAQQIYELEDIVYSIDFIQGIPLEKYREALDNEFKLLLEGKKEYNIKFEIKTLKSNIIKHIHSKAIYRPKQNKVFGVIQDITELVQHRTEIENLNTRLTIANESVSNGIWDWNLGTNELIWDEMMFRLYGITKTDFTDTYASWRNAVVPEDLEDAEKELKEVIDSKGIFDYQFRIKHPKLGVRYIRSFAKYTELNEPHLIGVNYDNTDRVYSKQRIKESESLFRNLFDQNNDIILLLNRDGDILDLNKKGVEYFDFTANNSKRISYRDITVSIEEQIHSEDVIKRLKNNEIIKPYIKKFRSFNGTIAPFEVSISGIYDQSGELIQLVSILRDIKERLEHEKELEKQKRRAEESDKLKSAFLMNVSHEIRTPLNGIMGFTEILNAELQDTEFKEFIDIIEDSSNRLLNSIDDILDISYIQTNQLYLSIQEFVLGGTLNSIFNKYKKIYRTKLNEIEFNLNVDSEYNEIVLRTDQQKFQTAVSKLVDNALKFTHHGKVNISCYLSETRLYLSIEDTGVGIDNEKIKNIFDFFNQGENTLTRSFEGLGLGLTISSNLLKALGTELKVSSKLGEGSKFWFEIPMANLDSLAAISSTNMANVNDALHKILFVDRYKILTNPTSLFNDEVCEIHITEDINDAQNLLEDVFFDAVFIVISNINSKEKELIVEIRKKEISSKIIILSRATDLALRNELIAFGADEVFSDNIDKDTIAKYIKCQTKS